MQFWGSSAAILEPLGWQQFQQLPPSFQMNSNAVGHISFFLHCYAGHVDRAGQMLCKLLDKLTNFPKLTDIKSYLPMSQFVYAMALGVLGNRIKWEGWTEWTEWVRKVLMWLMGLWQWSGRKCCKQLCFSLVNKWTSRTGFDTFSGYTHTHAHTLCGMQI